MQAATSDPASGRAAVYPLRPRHRLDDSHPPLAATASHLHTKIELTPSTVAQIDY